MAATKVLPIERQASDRSSAGTSTSCSNEPVTAHFMNHKPSLESETFEVPISTRFRRFDSFSSSIKSDRTSPLSIITVDLSSNENLACGGLSFMSDDFLPPTPDALHNISKPYPRHGPARYIIESDNTFNFFSRRGWMNLVFILILTVGLIVLFAIWPIVDYVRNSDQRRTDQALFTQAASFVIEKKSSFDKN